MRLGRALLGAGLLLALLPAAAGAGTCRIAIDIGHTRQAPGAISARGVPERQFNAALAGRLNAALAARGIAALLIDPAGDPISLRDRPREAAEAGATLLISIHHDSVQPRYLSTWQWNGAAHSYSDGFSGYGLFVSAKNPAFDESRRIATVVADGLLAAGLRPSLHHAEKIAGENRPLLDAARGIYQYDDLVVVKYATMPALLIEAGVIVNRADEPTIAGAAYQDKVVGALTAAVADHCKRVGAAPSL